MKRKTKDIAAELAKGLKKTGDLRPLSAQLIMYTAAAEMNHHLGYK